MNETPTPETLTAMHEQEAKLLTLLEAIERSGTLSTTTSGADYWSEIIEMRMQLKEKINREIASKL